MVSSIAFSHRFCVMPSSVFFIWYNRIKFHHPGIFSVLFYIFTRPVCPRKTTLHEIYFPVFHTILLLSLDENNQVRPKSHDLHLIKFILCNVRILCCVPISCLADFTWQYKNLIYSKISPALTYITKAIKKVYNQCLNG